MFSLLHTLNKGEDGRGKRERRERRSKRKQTLESHDPLAIRLEGKVKIQFLESRNEITTSLTKKESDERKQEG
jgi:hypothetical protein